MPKYKSLLKKDLIQEFKNRPKIDALADAFGKQLNELGEFYVQLYEKRFISSAEGKQLDIIGDILVLTRDEAKAILGVTDDLNDDLYRQMLIYKAQLNFGDGTYRSIMNCLKLLTNSVKDFKYKEETSHPATIIFETESKPSAESVKELLSVPFPRAGGVGVIIRSKEKENLILGTGFTVAHHFSMGGESDDADVDDYTVISDENGLMLADEGFNLITE